MIAGDRVDILARRQLLARPQRMVPAAADDPILRRCRLGMFGDALLHLGQRLHADQIDLQRLPSAVGEMQMRIVESRHHEVPAEIDDLRVIALQLANVVVGADGDDAAIAHRHRLRASRSRFGVDVAVEEDDVGGDARGIAGCGFA